ncbi:pentapeptide repeat-containing protein [Actinokineospora inagensis]|uniref:pentapeptide repeat-containing protein n=1 Tax=Actinokineospora inagensis TaxID=103730 RepID=UPI000684F990|nr:pentapeptide repeat-containing protein [Actinokineospora inagensis]
MGVWRPTNRQAEGLVLLAVGGALLVAASLAVSGVLRWSDVLRWLRSWGPLAGLALVAFVCVVVGARAVRGGRGGPRAVQPIRWWVFAAAAVLVVGMTWAGVSGFLTLVPPTDPVARLEAVKTGLAVGGGAVAGMALLFTARKQWLSERTQVHTETDATERRVADLLHNAVEQFGTDKDTLVRLGGLSALELLGQEHPDMRQIVVNLVCESLVLGHPHVQVSRAAQRLLTTHLRRTSDQHWTGIDLNLTGAHLVDFDLSDCVVRTAVFTNAHFTGAATFRGAQFTEVAVFRDARFTAVVTFSGATFAGNAEFTGTRFDAEVTFDSAGFGGVTSFHRANFAGVAIFASTDFRGSTSFAESTGDATPNFFRVRCATAVNFRDARLGALGQSELDSLVAAQRAVVEPRRSFWGW